MTQRDRESFTSRGTDMQSETDENVRGKAIRILSQEVYRDFGPHAGASIWQANTASRWDGKCCGR
jgi:hypothetical protein